MHRPFDEPERRHSRSDDGDHFVENFDVVPAGGHIERLLEERSVERVRLVEDRQNVEFALPEHTFHDDFGAGNESFDEQGFAWAPTCSGENEADSFDGLSHVRWCVGSNHTAARRQGKRFQHHRKPQLRRQSCDVDAGFGHLERRLSDRTAQRPPHGRLVAGGRNRMGRVVRKPQCFGSVCGGQDAGIVDGNDRVEWRAGGTFDDLARGFRGMVQVGQKEVGLVGQELSPLRNDREVDAQPHRRLDEIPCSIGGGGENDSYPRHHTMIVRLPRKRRIAVPSTPMTNEPVLDITAEAIEKIIAIRDGEPSDGEMALFIEITGIRGPEFVYELSFMPVDDAQETDHLARYGDLAVLVPAKDVEKFAGATLSMGSDPSNPALSINNPNTPASPMAAGAEIPGHLEGPLADKVQQVLERHVNPSIAGHGGAARLVSVDEGVAYLQLMGGCQGCGMANVTLKQGIERILKDAIPELVAVEDVTDHASGDNPYYQSAKK